DFAVSSDPLRVTLRVLVFDIDSGREGANRVTINRTQLFIEPAILFGTPGHLLDQPVGMNPNPDVSHHCSNGFKIFSGETFTTGFATKQYKPGQPIADDHRNR